MSVRLLGQCLDSCLIVKAYVRSKPGSSLIDQAAMIKQAASKLKSGSCLIDQNPGLWEVYTTKECTDTPHKYMVFNCTLYSTL